MPEEVFVITLISMIASAAILGKLVWGYVDRLKHREITPKSIASLDARMERIEQAVDTIAVEIERISEGQRFTTKLLSERAAAPALSAPAKNLS
ncbi:MAG: hypothetical protein H7Z74_05590 [Anaerolineae bacterium]|nr:hypothetical protein [Gemmatimonadaceae bacterium]